MSIISPRWIYQEWVDNGLVFSSDGGGAKSCLRTAPDWTWHTTGFTFPRPTKDGLGQSLDLLGLLVPKPRNLVVFLSLCKTNKQTKQKDILLTADHRAKTHKVFGKQHTALACPISTSSDTPQTQWQQWPKAHDSKYIWQVGLEPECQPNTLESAGTPTAPSTGPAHTRSCLLCRFQMCCLFTIFDDYK